jgi:hypothetical protein
MAMLCYTPECYANLKYSSGVFELTSHAYFSQRNKNKMAELLHASVRWTYIQTNRASSLISAIIFAGSTKRFKII